MRSIIVDTGITFNLDDLAHKKPTGMTVYKEITQYLTSYGYAILVKKGTASFKAG